jgi:murein DD-endopeptidase MepM/ murein hydrolase activator NlpD
VSAVLPVPGGRIPTSGILSFGYQRTATHTHQGIDIPAPTGTPVLAAEGGTVEQAYSSLGPGFSGYGRVIVIRKGDSGPWLLYAHLDKVLVERGQRIARGQKIGTVGRTCFNKSDPTRQCSGPHLHFEVSARRYPQDSEAPRINPVAWLEGAGPAGGIGLTTVLALGTLWWIIKRG